MLTAQATSVFCQDSCSDMFGIALFPCPVSWWRRGLRLVSVFFPLPQAVVKGAWGGNRPPAHRRAGLAVLPQHWLLCEMLLFHSVLPWVGRGPGLVGVGPEWDVNSATLSGRAVLGENLAGVAPIVVRASAHCCLPSPRSRDG